MKYVATWSACSFTVYLYGSVSHQLVGHRPWNVFLSKPFCCEPFCYVLRVILLHVHLLSRYISNLCDYFSYRVHLNIAHTHENARILTLSFM